MSEYVLFVHGDLLTKERIDAVRHSCRIERTPKDWFQYIVFLPGLFHYKMACADAIWRTYLQPADSQSDPNSLYEHIGMLRPKETGKLISKPGFRRMHNIVHHDLTGSMLNCWQHKITKRNPQCSSIELFATTKPTWEDIVDMSDAIVAKYIGTSPDLHKERSKPFHERDKVYGNQLLHNCDELMYVDLCHAMNSGDVGHVEASFLPWIHIFVTVGKHKYAAQISKILCDLCYQYPPDLSQLIHLNLLCNPKGVTGAWCAIDWLVERNNLYTKVIVSGLGSNCTIDHIIEHSPLIEVFRHCHIIVKNPFHLLHHTIRHQPPDMTKTIEKLTKRLLETKPHKFTAGRKLRFSVDDKVASGFGIIQKKG
ncbi:hypothetical protein SERLA73DRAFT_46371 [Serpula lacrymans var. lacrymans S7.3]|uniref:DUF6589 domain-containing protein n=1 Tax=Serpula lacrymans var. lacrymans (strain S7.3) TaxID=936435 RepID=F8PJG6_SERL3|nr:hypothetical protein SERLA73DRAFT_46371 [Serpula lacrymans var. lacrymans S7.3]